MPYRDYEPDWGKGHPDYEYLTRMLCGLCKLLAKDNSAKAVDELLINVPGLLTWWKKHQEQDRKREAAEREAKKRQEEKEIAELKRLQKKYPKVK